MPFSLRFGSVVGSVALAPLAAAQLSIVSNLPGTFVDISSTGNALSLTDDGSALIATTRGNALLPPGAVVVGSNGAVRFQGTSTMLGYFNWVLPSASVFGGAQALLPFWDDINTQSGARGEIYWQEVAGTFIVQWHDVAFYGSGLDTARFQLQVPSTGATWARFVYADVMQPRPNGGASATIGYQAGGYGDDVQFSFDTAGAVMDGTVLSLIGPYTPPPLPPAITIVDNVPGTWIEISGTGAALGLDDDDAVDIQTTVGNALFAAGVVRVGSNGGVRFFGAGQYLDLVNTVLPSPGAFDAGSQVLLPYWDDIDTEHGLWGDIYWQEVAGTLVIQWEATAFFNGSPAADTVTFQIQVNASGDPLAQFLYADVSSVRASGGGSATIGVQGGTSTQSALWSFNTPWAVNDGDVLTIVAGPARIGTNYCSANVNSTGVAASMFATGSESVATNDVTLGASLLPFNAFGFFLTSLDRGFVAGPGGSQGNLCLGGAIGRYVGPGQIQSSGAAGTISLAVDLTQHPTPSGFAAVQAGETWRFTAWFRDVAAGSTTSNFADGLEIVFQ